MSHGPALALVVTALVLPAAAGCGSNGDGIGVAGAPYEVELPREWREATEEEIRAFREAGTAGIEHGLGGEGAAAGVAVTDLWLEDPVSARSSNIAVLSEPVPADVSIDRFLAALRHSIRRAVGDALSREFTEVKVGEVGGAPTSALDYGLRLGEAGMAKRAVIVIRSDQAFTVTLTARPNRFAAGKADLRRILASWRWID